MFPDTSLSSAELQNRKQKEGIIPGIPEIMVGFALLIHTLGNSLE